MPTEKKPLKPLNDYGRYSGIAFKMIAIILIGVFGGIQLDKWIKFKIPVFTVVLSILSVALAMYSIIREFLKK